MPWLALPFDCLKASFLSGKAFRRGRLWSPLIGYDLSVFGKMPWLALDDAGKRFLDRGLVMNECALYNDLFRDIHHYFRMLSSSSLDTSFYEFDFYVDEYVLKDDKAT